MKSILSLTCIIISFIACNEVKNVKPSAKDTKAVADSFKKSFPKPLGYVNDFYSLFTIEQIQSLDSLISAYEKKTTAQIAVVTLDSSYTEEKEFDNYSLELARAWGVGTKEKNNGILIAICPDYRKMRIQNGFGIEPYLSDAETKQVLDSVIFPEFRKANFYKGIYNGIVTITRKLDEAGLK